MDDEGIFEVLFYNIHNENIDDFWICLVYQVATPPIWRKKGWRERRYFGKPWWVIHNFPGQYVISKVLFVELSKRIVVRPLLARQRKNQRYGEMSKGNE